MTDKIQPIVRKKLSDVVQERLLEIVKSGELQPGDVIPSERQLMEQFAVGRPAIREAMQNLERMGLIRIRHGERPRIAEPSFDTVMGQLAESMQHLLAHSATTRKHLKEARVLFEAQMARAAAKRRDDDDIARLREALDRQRNAKSDHDEFLKCDGQFHQEIARISGNPIFEGLSESFFDWLRNFQLDMISSPGLEDLVLEEHTRILEAIIVGDAEEAEHRVGDHIYRSDARYEQLKQGG